jgi:CheY-like chemotaxis protein
MTYEQRRPVVLVADDSEIDRYLLRRAFARARVDVSLHFVADGEELLEYLAGDRAAVPVDLVLLDLQMPRLGGREALRAIRAREELDGLPVIVLTADDDPERQREMFALGASGYFTKSADAQERVAVLECVVAFWLARAARPARPH